jgi:hypothetical protein
MRAAASRLRPAAAVMTTAVALAGCVSVPTTPGAALGDAAKASVRVVGTTQRLLHRWCPAAFGNRHPTPTRAQALVCVHPIMRYDRSLLRTAGAGGK